MVRLWGRDKGNFPYACARVKAKKSLLLTKDNYPKLLMMDLNEIGRFLGETQYKVEMAELGAKYEGVNLIELGTARNLARVNRQILQFCTGELHETVAKYLGRWDYWNIKTILRGKFSGATVEEVQEELVASGNLSEEYLLYLYTLDNISDILEDVRRKAGVSLPEEIKAAFEANGTLGPIEDYLDKLYYQNLIAQLEKGSRADKTLLTFVKKEVDTVNLLTLLKLKRDKVQVDKAGVYFIEGGQELPVKELMRLAGMENLEQTANELSKLSFYESIKEDLQKSVANNSLTDVGLSVRRYLARQAERFGHVYPMSVLPIVDYMVRKKNEVDNIRVIARGKQSGLDVDQIKKLLVV
ncbi:MAG: V-type ATP synthase subunit C [Methanomassiliicoccales archaeon PtaU1.Bin124]|nr:MAG: V-type ATP synthase subunit C [Methanomassiliicoccales archaeon PtaU1.Bin124]